MTDFPTGAIENGREHFRRLAEHYDFTCEGGPLSQCVDFQEALRCFEHLAEFVANYEPTEVEQGLIPIPEGYNEP